MSVVLDRSLNDAAVARRRGLLQRFNIDPLLLLLLLLLTGIGLVVLYSAAREATGPLLRQGIHAGIGIVVMLVLAQVPPHQMRYWTPWIYALTIVLLLAVLVTGVVGKGAQRWLNLGVIRFQPSEIMKIALPMMLAWLYANKPLPPATRYLFIGVALIALPGLLVVRQPDLGTALLLIMAGVFTLFLAGLSWWIIGGISGAAALIAPLFWTFVMHDYQRQRVLTFIAPETDPLGAGWNIIQSKIAIGSGGLYGKGWLNGTQSTLNFLPEGTTDFIFAVYAEEFGLTGVLLLLLLYFAIVARCLSLASRAADTYGRLLAGSLALVFASYVIINASMVAGLLPVVGLPLPLISYGGTAIVTIFAGFGILMSAYSHQRLMTR